MKLDMMFDELISMYSSVPADIEADLKKLLKRPNVDRDRVRFWFHLNMKLHSQHADQTESVM